jgi:hypothetical protein
VFLGQSAVIPPSDNQQHHLLIRGKSKSMGWRHSSQI